MKHFTNLNKKHPILMTPSPASAPMRTLITALFTISLAFAAVLLCGGCKKSSSSGLTAAEIKALDTAAPEVKQIWQAALQADGTNDYTGAHTLYSALLRENLTPAQSEVVVKASTTLNQRMFSAAQKGDPAAQAAVQELRHHAPNRQR
jgi:hypothetical protein